MFQYMAGVNLSFGGPHGNGQRKFANTCPLVFMDAFQFKGQEEPEVRESHL